MPVDDAEEALRAVDEGNAAVVDCVVKEEVSIGFVWILLIDKMVVLR